MPSVSSQLSNSLWLDLIPPIFRGNRSDRKQGRDQSKNMKVLKFIKAKSPYAVGDVAGVDDAQADAMMEEGVAELVSATTAPAKPPKDKAVKSPRKKKSDK